MLNILLTNDDGIYAVGLRALYKALQEAGHTVYVVAPMTEQSAVGHALTVFQTLRAKEITEPDFHGLGVHGTPSDCVKLALSALLPKKPDMVISGINAGANVGPDILYSGTVAAATEAAHNNLRAMALSYDFFHPVDILEHARHATHLMQNIPWDVVPSRCVVNVNYPHKPLAQCLPLRLCPQTSALWKDDYEERLDPRGNRYWWVKGNICMEDVEKNTDKDLLAKGHITMTPLRFEFTHTEVMEALARGMYNK